MKQVSFLYGFLFLITAHTSFAKFKDLHLLPPAPLTSEEAFKELDPACVDHPLEGDERGWKPMMKQET